MIFRKNTWSFRATQVLCLTGLAGSLWSMTKVYPDLAASMLLVGLAAVMLLLLVFNPWNQRLYIDGSGIRCFRRNRTLWSLRWDEIDRIRPVTVFGCRGYLIIPKQVQKRDLQCAQPRHDYTLEHTRRIRAALAQYGPKLLEKRS